MEVREIELPLTGFGVPRSSAQVEIQELSYNERIKRSAVAFGVAAAIALVAIPIPLVHLVLVPGALLGGIVMALLRLRQDRVFRGAQGRCPFCGKEQSFLLMGRVRLPKQLSCGFCHQPLSLEPTSEPPRSPT
ncbi:MAG TPA: hypothetical protein VIM84_02415 [Gemmatimonadales bacterium]